MRVQALWMPGDFLTTNKLLDLQRSSGYYEGVRRERGGGRRSAAPTFADVVQGYRGDANIRARAARLSPVEGRVHLAFLHLGSGRRDPSSWYLAAKAIEDGLVDAGVLDSDRFNVCSTGGRAVALSKAEWRDRVSALTGVVPTTVGMLVALLPEGEGGCIDGTPF